MSETTKTFRMPAEISETVEQLAKSRGQTFTAFVVEALEAKISGPNAFAIVKAPTLEISEFLKVLRTERLSHTELTETLLALNKAYREVLEEKSRTFSSLKEAQEGLERAKTQLSETAQIGEITSQRCEKTLQSLSKSSEFIDKFIEKSISSVRSGFVTIDQSSALLGSAAERQKEAFEHEMDSMRGDFAKIQREFKNEVTKQAKDFVLSVARRWQWVACVLVVSVFLGGAGLSSWIYFNKEDGISKLKSDNQSMGLELQYFRQQACQNKKAEIRKTYCKDAGLFESNFQNPYP